MTLAAAATAWTATASAWAAVAAARTATWAAGATARDDLAAILATYLDGTNEWVTT
jgi:hypothetical protein